MRFEHGQDPDPIRGKFRSISHIRELPDEYLKQHEELLKHACGIVADIKESTDCDEREAIMSFVAFQGMQIASCRRRSEPFTKPWALWPTPWTASKTNPKP